MTDKAGGKVTTDTITMTLLKTLKIVDQPADIAAYGNEAAAALVTAEGEEEIDYTWYLRLPGETSSELVTEEMDWVDYNLGGTLIFRMNPNLDGAVLSCVVTDAYYAKAYIDPITLTMKKAPDISELPALTLPAGLTAIEAEAFSRSAAQVIVVPEGCTSIGSQAFYANQSLEWLVIEGKTIEIAEDALKGAGNAKIICAQDSEARIWAEEHYAAWTYPESAGEE